MPPKKQPKPNGFMMFMIDMKPKLEAKGHKFPNGLADVHPVCTPLWNSLTSEQKSIYNQRAKGTSALAEEKCDSRGIPIAWREREEQRKIVEKTQIFQKIEDMISYLATQGELENHDFHLAHFNYAVKTDEGEYPPCEVGIVKFSLLNGVSNHYHEFIDPGKIRLGYSYEAVQHSEGTHRIPASGFKLYNSNYVAITDAIKSVLVDSVGSIAPLFFLDEDITTATYILEWLVEKSVQLDATYQRRNPFKIYSLNKLVYELRRHANLNDPRLKFTSTMQVAEKLCNGTFDFCPNMACEWHSEEDNVKFCSLSRVRNYAYTIADLCCEHYGLSLLPNRHCPAYIADEQLYEVLPAETRSEKEVIETPPVKEKDTRYSVPRMPGSFANVIASAGHAIGPRVAANFKSSTQGIGRGLLGLSIASDSSSDSSSSSDSPPSGRGRGRGLLLFSD